MTNAFRILVLCMIAQISLGQTFFDYDQAGNRIRRTFTPIPDLVVSLLVRPTLIYGAQPISAVITVININQAPTTEPVTVYVTKNPKADFSFEPTRTVVGTTMVQNANWSQEDSPDPNYYIFTSNASMAGETASSIGLTGTFSPGIHSGVGSITAIVFGGGELNLGNNVESTRITYFNH